MKLNDFHIFCVRYSKRNELREWLNKNKIKTEIHYPIPPHRQEAMKDILLKNWPIADSIAETSLSLPISNGTKVSEVKKICKIIQDFPI